MKRYVLLIMIPLAIAWYFFRDHYDYTQTNKPFSIVCTTSMIADTLRELVGDDAHVTGLMGPDVDPHLYRAREHDIHTLASADLIVYNGLHLEGKLADVLQSMDRYVPTVGLANHLDSSRFIASDEYDTLYDPHIWFDVTIWIEVTQIMRDALMKYDPEHADAYQKRAATYIQKLQDLDTFIRDEVAKLAPNQRKLVTAHDAFHYFGRAYGFEVVALQGISTESEAGIKDVQELVDYIVMHKIRAIFVEASIPERNIQAVQHAARARGWEVSIGDELYSDALGPEESDAGSYSGMVKHNVQAIISALHGN